MSGPAWPGPPPALLDCYGPTSGAAAERDVYLGVLARGWLLRREISSDSAMWPASMARSP